jgi:ABC-2 type transport system ATP-binding protein
MADAGRVLMDGKPLKAEDVFHIGYMPEERGLYKKMRVGEQAIFFARLKGLSRSEAERRLRTWFERLNIADWWERKVEDLSKGMAQKVQFIATVVHEPKLLIFDEPFSGFDPINANLLKEEILGLRDRGATVIFSTHNMSSVEEICDHITLINKSRNILSGKVDDIRRAHGGNTFAVQYKGDGSTLCERLHGVCEVIESEVSSTGFSTLKVHIPRNEDIRAVVTMVNDMVEMRQFTETIPSMNDIFIRACQHE